MLHRLSCSERIKLGFAYNGSNALLVKLIQLVLSGVSVALTNCLNRVTLQLLRYLTLEASKKVHEALRGGVNLTPFLL